MSILARILRSLIFAPCIGALAFASATLWPTSALGATACTEIYGSGSGLQGVAQVDVWIQGWPSHTSCNAAGTVTYTPTTTRSGLREFGNDFGAKLDAAEDPTANPTLDAYIAADNAPSAGELGEAITAAGQGSGKAQHEITIPVLQAPISVLLSLPVKCKVTTGANIQIPNKLLEEAWFGELPASGSYKKNTWGALLKQSYSGGKTPIGFTDGGGETTGCSQTITLQARSNESGASFIYKSYLAQINSTRWNEFANELDSWPTSSKVTTTGNSSNALLTQDVAKKPGSIGYADTADAAELANGAFTGVAHLSSFGGSESHDILWAQIQNTKASGEKEIKFAAPSTRSGTANVANCSTSITGIGPSNIYDTWVGTLVSSPTIEGGHYPICGLGYDLAWHEYTEEDYGSSVCEVASTVNDYLKYVTTAAQGQTEIQSNYYTEIPTSIATKAKEAAEAVGATC